VPLGDPDFGKAAPCPSCSPAPQSTGLPAGLASKTFADFDLRLNPEMAIALSRCRAVAEGRVWCAFLMGAPGVGKSLLAVGALAASVHPRPGRWWNWGDFLRQVRHLAFSESGPQLAEDDVLRPWMDASVLLVLDDVGAEKVSEWTAQTLYAVIDARYQAQLPTIVTTNNPSAIDDRVLSRLYAGAVACKGQDVRTLDREALA
jgi:DNA replication protein DnaC